MPESEVSLNTDLLVVGGGIAGITTAVESSEAGLDVVLIEKEPYLGGRVSRFHHYFPKLCPPACGLEINYKRLRGNPSVKIYTLSEVQSIEGKEGDYTVTITVKPRYVHPWAMDYTEWAKSCPVEIEDDFNYGLNNKKAVYRNYENAFPQTFVVDESVVDNPDFREWVKSCPDGGIDLEMKPLTIKVKTASIAWATGWQPYDANKLDILSYGKHPDIITNVMMERLAAENGPTAGKITLPSGKDKVGSVAFVQCAGSRDENHLPFCSGVCCLASLKQASYVLEQYPEADVHMFYIDVRTPGRLEDFYQEREENPKINMHRGKVARVDIEEDGLIVTAENTLTATLEKVKVDLVVLATGMQPSTMDTPPPIDISMDENGFIEQKADAEGIYGVGTCVRPYDVAATLQDATGAAVKALQMARRA
ncbi:FAD-dependent oxidoreductase [bacterium]|nr:FAD-dependent oxidoreductase [bacterium]